MAKRVTKNNESAVFQRMLSPDNEGIPPEAARFVLSLRFHADDVARINKLSELAQQGELTHEAQDELNSYERMGTLLGILQAKARLSQPRERMDRKR